MDKKGQAAMEFLMTYGWAILAALIAIGVLAYFGVFSRPTTETQNSCLTIYAVQYCRSVNMTYVDDKMNNNMGSATTFLCKPNNLKDNDAYRIYGPLNQGNEFYFLPSELKDCKK